jgi:putative ABC transport system ATP-binding protein
MTDPVIVASGITHTFGSGATAFTALRAVGLEVYPGEVLLLMGPSGSGKTTLVHILGCLLRPTEGGIVLNGQAVGSLGDDALGALRLRNFGFVFQAYNLFPMLTATENVMVALDPHGRESACRPPPRARAAHPGRPAASSRRLSERIEQRPETARRHRPRARRRSGDPDGR